MWIFLPTRPQRASPRPQSSLHAAPLLPLLGWSLVRDNTGLVRVAC